MGGRCQEILVRPGMTHIGRMQKKRNYSRFYAICRAKGIDLEQFKEDLVSEFTGGRATSLRDMRNSEYEDMCDCLQSGRRQPRSREDFAAERRRLRSAVLKRLQKLGVDTTDFDKVNEFCLNGRIAGKPFGMLTMDELEALIPKLEAIAGKKPRQPRAAEAIRICVGANPDRLPS